MTARELLGDPALVLTSVLIAYVLVCEVLHITGHRWRVGVPEALAVAAGVGAVAVVVARFLVLT